MRHLARIGMGAALTSVLALVTVTATRGGAPRRRTLAAVVAVALLLVAAPASSAVAAPAGDVEVVAAFDDPRPGGDAGELPEGVAVDRKGHVYASLGPPFFTAGLPGLEAYGAIVTISPDGSRRTVVEFPDGPAPAGVVVDAAARVFFTVPDPGGPDVGVYGVTRGGEAERIAGTEQMAVPNGLALDRRGGLVVSDSALGQIWRIGWPARLGYGGDPALPWLTHPLLAGCQPGQVGANGVAFYRGDLYVANTERGLLLRVPVLRDGSPGTPIIVAGDEDCETTDELYGLDGIAINRRGHVYGALVLQNKLVTIQPDTGTATVVLDADDGLWNPASLAFGTARGERDSLYITNYAVLPPAPPANLGPAVLKLRTAVPGWRGR